MSAQLPIVFQAPPPPVPAASDPLWKSLAQHETARLLCSIDVRKLKGVDQHLLYAARVRFEETGSLSPIQCALVRRLAGLDR